MDIKIFTYGGQGGEQGALSIQKNEKILRTVPFLKSNRIGGPRGRDPISLQSEYGSSN